MSKIVFDKLFIDVKNVTGLVDVGYLEIRDGRLYPIYKTSTDTLDLKKWRNTHSEHPVYINKTTILQEITNQRKPAVVKNVKTDMRSADAFFLLGIDSILIIPVIVDEVITGIYCIASIGKPHDFQEDEVKKCEELINLSREKILYREGVHVEL